MVKIFFEVDLSAYTFVCPNLLYLFFCAFVFHGGTVDC